MASVQSVPASGVSVAPPSMQEIARKLSMHNRPVKTHAQTHSQAQLMSSNALVSGAESDSDSFLQEHLSQSGSTHGHAHCHSMTLGISPSASSKPLSSIAERRSRSGDEESDEDEDADGDEEWPQEIGLNVRLPKVRPGGESVIKTGYLLKKGERRKTWKKRWFVLRPAQLAFYKSSAEYKLLRLVDLSDVHSCTPVSLKRHANSFVLVSPSRTYYLQAETEAEMRDWVQRLNEAREALLGTSTQNSLTTVPIPTPAPSTNRGHTNAPSQSPPVVSGVDIATAPPPPIPVASSVAAVTSESDSEDQNAFSAPRAGLSVNSPASKAPVSKDGNGSKVILQAYLMKCRSKRRGWRKRWFVLTNDRLLYSASHMDTHKRQRCIELSQIIDALEYDPDSGGLVSSPPAYDDHTNGDREGMGGPSGSGGGGGKFMFKIVTTKRSLLLCAPSEPEELKWVSAIRALIARRTNPPGSGNQQLAETSAGGAKATGPVNHRKRSVSGASGRIFSKDD